MGTFFNPVRKLAFCGRIMYVKTANFWFENILYMYVFFEIFHFVYYVTAFAAESLVDW